MIVGVSTRQYGRSLEPLPVAAPSRATSKSEVSRTFVTRTRAQMAVFLNRPLGELDLPVILVDGVAVGDHVLVVALGLDGTGRKQVLGLREGTTESEAVARALFTDLVERGLPIERARLFVIDGGKGVRAGIRRVFGAWAVIARCQIHKLRNVADHLPDGKRAFVRAAMRKAYRSGSATQAERQLLQLAQSLEPAHPGAASSLREGLADSLTVLRLGVGPALTRTLSSTNPIENLNGTLRRISRRVKRWHGGAMAVRWGASALFEAEKKFRRVKGYREMPGLLAALCDASTTQTVDMRADVA